MNELDLYKFLENNNVETHWVNDGGPEWHLAAWIPHHALKEFCNMLGAYAFDDGGIADVMLCSDASIYIGNFDEICDWFGIDPERIVDKYE